MPNTTDPKLIDEVIAFQHEWAATIGREFSKGNWEIGKQFYNDPDDLRHFDLQHGELDGPAFFDYMRQVAPFYGEQQIEFSDFVVHGEGDTAFVSMIQTFSGVDSEGRDFTFRFRATNGMRRIDGRWRIVHEHLSFPVDMETRQADLQSRR